MVDQWISRLKVLAKSIGSLVIYGMMLICTVYSTTPSVNHQPVFTLTMEGTLLS